MHTRTHLNRLAILGHHHIPGLDCVARGHVLAERYQAQYLAPVAQLRQCQEGGDHTRSSAHVPTHQPHAPRGLDGDTASVKGHTCTGGGG